MSLWFRMYSDVINDPKVLRLSDALFRAWMTLLCIAAKNDGALPPTSDIALMLREKPAKVAAWITELVRAGLIDKTETGFAPHNWSGRQYKSDVSTSRVKQFRERQRNVSPAVTETPPDTETETEDRIVDARERPSSRFTDSSKALSDAFWKAIGSTSPLDISPEYAGTDWRAVIWENAGYTPDLVESETRRVGPGKPLKYYEKVFATAFAKRQAPLPVVEITPPEKIHVQADRASRTNSLAEIAMRDAAAGIEFGPRPTGLRQPESGAPVRLLSKS